jgi:DNA-binding response OmpR family regulator
MPGRVGIPNILVVEDEPLIAAMLDELIGSWGVVPHVARNLEEARVALSLLTFEAALVDFSLGDDERASEIIDVLIERGTPVAFVTGYDHDALEPRHASLPLLRKPFTERELCTLLSLLLGPVANCGSRAAE